MMLWMSSSGAVNDDEWHAQLEAFTATHSHLESEALIPYLAVMWWLESSLLTYAPTVSRQ